MLSRRPPHARVCVCSCTSMTFRYLKAVHYKKGKRSLIPPGLTLRFVKFCCRHRPLISSCFFFFDSRERRNALPHGAENICWREQRRRRKRRKGSYIHRSGKRKEVRGKKARCKGGVEESGETTPTGVHAQGASAGTEACINNVAENQDADSALRKSLQRAGWSRTGSFILRPQAECTQDFLS